MYGKAPVRRRGPYNMIQFRVNSSKSVSSPNAYRLQLYLNQITKMLFKKQELHSLDFSPTYNKSVENFEAWAESNELSHLHGWLLPQLVAYFGSWTLAYTSDGRIDCLKTIKQNCLDPQQRSFYTLTRIKRSVLVPSQTKSPDYATLTPLILMGLKRMQGVKYEAWKTAQDLSWILEPRLYESLMLEPQVVEACCSLGSDRLIEIRNQGLLARTGAKAGQMKPAKSTWSLTGIQDTELGSLPKITQTILTQCWLAHPESRTPYMILDLQDWDAMPQPLVTNDIFKAAPTSSLPKKQNLKELADVMPWDL